MKISLVVKNWDGTFSRAALPGEAQKEYHSNLLYSPAHTAMISRGFEKAKPVHQAEAVYVRSNGFKSKGGKLERVRKLPETAIEAFDQLDVQREKLQALISGINKAERQLMAEIYSASTPLKMTEVRGFKDLQSAKAE